MGQGDRVVNRQGRRARCRAKRAACTCSRMLAVRDLGLAVLAAGVAEVDDLEPVEDLETQFQASGARAHTRWLLMVCGPNRVPGLVGRRDVERQTDVRHSGRQGTSKLLPTSVRNGLWPNETTRTPSQVEPSATPGGRSR